MVGKVHNLEFYPLLAGSLHGLTTLLQLSRGKHFIGSLQNLPKIELACVTRLSPWWAGSGHWTDYNGLWWALSRFTWWQL